PQFKLASTYFTDKEYSELCFIVDSYSSDTETKQVLANKLKSLGKGKHDEGLLLGDQLVVSTSASNQFNGKLQQVRQAIVDNRLLAVCYHDAKGQATQRNVEPLSLVMKDGVWYVYAYCRLRKEFRYFKLSRMVNVVLCDTKFRPRHYVVDVEEIQSSVTKDKQEEEIILTVNAQSLTKVEEWLGLESVSPIDDYYIARAKVVIDDFVVDKVLSLGSGATVEKPEKLRNAVVEKCSQIAKNYN
ncbi:MAG: WYL domain-containing protein, partial [Clostridia bacterium]|nr:WYL domain-containing protein [Clostridia bacterium]